MASTNHFQCIFLAFLFALGVLSSQASSRLLNEQTMIEMHEQWMARVDRAYKLHVNQFANLTDEEFRASHTGYKKQPTKVTSISKPTSFRYANVTDVPATIDWREKGAVTPVKDQGQCAAAVEGINQLKNGNLISLPEQELVDCNVDNNGCGGGSMDTAFFNLSNKTIASLQKALLQAVPNQPISIAIEVSGFDFKFYSSGVFIGNCGTNLDHVVTIIGWLRIHGALDGVRMDI
ncbi:hypothetical protein TEA_022209 [Camellia sinensis var. sinensis]|uniref:Peptidase C1A papain C-terminal domain-containing protein n=1 Tax=Camellia sinensis var. sinensis TaxID=542762 RepID=A0A4S4EWF0_CAMSN|nr:hypothetical protein TEA_022209 [Camellia sinensis var. sinensis]